MKRFIFTLFFLVAAVVPRAQAQTQQFLQVQGLAVTPFLIETDALAGKAQAKTIILTNTTDKPLPIEVSINDFTPDPSTGQAKFLPAGDFANPAYSLSQWITIAKQPSFTIPPKEHTEVVFIISPPQDASPGTHYGGLLFSYRPQSTNGDSVVVTQKVGVLVLASLGKASEQGNITELSAEPAGNSSDFRFLTSFTNVGNVHLKPKGEIRLTNVFGREVASIPVNSDAAIILPQNVRVFESLWKPGWRFGRYTATAILYFGNPKLEAQKSIVIWILPWQRLVLVLSILFVIGYILRRLQTLYNKRLLERTSKS